MTLLTTNEAASTLGVSRRGVQKMIERGKLPATRVGRDYVLAPGDVERAKDRSKPGRPWPKKETGVNNMAL